MANGNGGSWPMRVFDKILDKGGITGVAVLVLPCPGC